MKHCKACNINTNTERDLCPLCYEELTENDGTGPSEEFFVKRTINEKEERNENILKKLFLFLSICAVAVCTFINVLTQDSSLWAGLVALCILYIWVLILHTILSDRSLFEKILIQIGLLIAILFYCEWIAAQGKWMMQYVVPSIFITTTFILNMLSWILGKNNKSLLSCMLAYLSFGIFSGVVLIVGQVLYILLYQIELLYSGLSLLGTLVFGWKTVKEEFKKKMHI